MKRIKAYLLFTSWRYKLGIFLGLPAAAMALGLFWRYCMSIPGYGHMMMAVVIFFEILTDQGLFAGIQSREGYKLDYLKTSPLGPQMLRQGLVGDLIRRFFTAALCIGAGAAVGSLKVEDGPVRYLGVLLAVYVAETLALFVSRHTRSVILCTYTAYGGIVIGEILFLLVNVIPISGLWLADGLLAAAAAVISIFAVQGAMKKWRQTFFDGGAYEHS